MEKIIENVKSGLFLLNRFKGRSLHTSADEIPSELFLIHPLDLTKKANPTKTLKLLKKRFWDLNLMWKPGVKYSLHDLHDGICTYQYFFQGVIKNLPRLAWILREDVLPEILYSDLKNSLLCKLDEVLNLPITKENKVLKQNLDAVINTITLLMDLKDFEI